MIYLIHGTNTVDSRRCLIALKQNYENIEIINGKKLKADDLAKNFSQTSHNLFGKNSAALIEYFNGDWKLVPEKPPKGLDLIIWADEKLRPPKVNVKNFVFNRAAQASTFKLADAILFKNEKEAQISASQLLASKEPVEKILGTLNRSFYLVYCEKEKSLKDDNLHSFVREKIKEQAKMWSKSGLKKALVHLLRVDLDIKEGLKANLALPLFIGRVISF